ncbi:MAG: acyltransferase [Cytophagaceae bacterium]|nr:MAG: acyltransferase [Cytophagaceae bacterium]
MQTAVSETVPVTTEQLKLARTFDFNLEALRGVAAMLVVWHHFIFHQNRLDPAYTPTGIFSFNPPGHLSVLVFFVLSGYVIGRVHIEPLGGDDILPYLKKRFVRIYPIYFLTIIIAYLVAKESYPLEKIIGDLTIVRTLETPVIFENNPAWSLSYEVLFYLLFILVSFLRLNVRNIALFAGGIGVISISQQSYDSGSYALGFAFWLCGVLLAKRFPHAEKPSFALMVSMIFLLITLERFNFFTIVLAKIASVVLIAIGIFYEGRVPLSYIAQLPYCVLLVLVFASRQFAYKKHIVLAMMLAPALGLYNVLSTPGAMQDKTLVLPVCFYILALAVYFLQKPLEDLCSRLIHRLYGTGALSYGLYMIHFPIITIFYRIGWFSGTALTFGVRVVCYVILCAIASYLLEKKYQPWAKRLLS